jgi:hypothetical protein
MESSIVQPFISQLLSRVRRLWLAHGWLALASLAAVLPNVFDVS